MSLTLKDIAELFSNGKFDQVYEHLADNVTWTVVGENVFTGKATVIDNCSQVAAYFKSVTTHFNTANIIVDNNRIAIEGTAAFSREGKQLSYVWACDVYEFNENGAIEKITSYCIQDKK